MPYLCTRFREIKISNKSNDKKFDAKKQKNKKVEQKFGGSKNLT